MDKNVEADRAKDFVDFLVEVQKTGRRSTDE